MNRLEHNLDSGFHAALSAPARAADIDAADDLYGWLIGSWDMDVVHYRVDLRHARRRGEIHFGWVLEGRAVQDVWIMPPRGEPRRPRRKRHEPAMYGTTLRVWDPALRAWRVTYINPRTGQRDELRGRRMAAAISCRSARTPTARRFDGTSPTSRGIRSVGPAWRSRRTA